MLPKEWAKKSFLCFNSILVRLKALATLEAFFHAFSLFQFHTGSIKRTIVTTDAKQLSRFQFHTGSIKRFFLHLLAKCELCFNSILVRLKVREPVTRITILALFQFHTGSIKRNQRTKARGRRSRKVSIPYWFD